MKGFADVDCPYPPFENGVNTELMIVTKEGNPDIFDSAEEDGVVSSRKK